jgi:hypothetical protein
MCSVEVVCCLMSPLSRALDSGVFFGWGFGWVGMGFSDRQTDNGLLSYT